MVDMSEVSYGDSSPTNSVVSWQVDMAEKLLQRHESFTESFNEQSSVLCLSEEYQDDEFHEISPSSSPARVKEQRSIRELEYTKEGLRRDKIVRIMNSR